MCIDNGFRICVLSFQFESLSRFWLCIHTRAMLLLVFTIKISSRSFRLDNAFFIDHFDNRLVQSVKFNGGALNHRFARFIHSILYNIYRILLFLLYGTFFSQLSEFY